MKERIRWTCLGSEYLLTKAGETRIVSGQTWHAIASEDPRPKELKVLWTMGIEAGGADDDTSRRAWNLELGGRLRDAIRAAQAELDAMREEAEEGRIARRDVRLQEMRVIESERILNDVEDAARCA